MSMRRAEVLSWLARGKSNLDIAEILCISPRTAHKHLERIFVKLGVDSRSSAASVALKAVAADRGDGEGGGGAEALVFPRDRSLDARAGRWDVRRNGVLMSEELSELSSRLVALETALAHQDRTVAELNDVIASQWRRIDALERQLARLREEFQTLGHRDAPEPPPPHY
ncbi:SlyX family protein [Methylosinus sporium]|uniref:SlyX family protein n=2 Tax=Methylosinus sporium TaxID=428 RepID=UPI00279634C4|nr:SlyX family protein [Methylosinus sporium]